MVKDYEFTQILDGMLSELNDWTQDKNTESSIFQVEYNSDFNNKILVNIIEYLEECKSFENNKFRLIFERIDKDDEDYDKTMDL